MLYISRMKRNGVLLLMLMAGVALLAWGDRGHRVVALIAQKHLSGAVAINVNRCLNGERIEEASTWPDEHHTYETEEWHYINLPAGLSREQFEKSVRSSKNNVYTALLQMQLILQSTTSTADQKKNALRFLIHLVGDAHQPMHVSRSEDKGGNAIPVNFEGHSTNLHTLWDSRLINKEGLSESQMLAQYDMSTAAEIKQWQQDDPVQWLWESYQLSAELYSIARSRHTAGNDYYRKYIAVIHKRVNQAGIRLAAQLNRLFDPRFAGKNTNSPKLPVVSTEPERPAQPDKPVRVALQDIGRYTNKIVTVSGKVYSTKQAGSLLLANLGAPYPHQLLVLAIKKKVRSQVPVKAGDMVTATGKLILFKGDAEIVIEEAKQLSVQ